MEGRRGVRRLMGTTLTGWDLVEEVTDLTRRGRLLGLFDAFTFCADRVFFTDFTVGIWSTWPRGGGHLRALIET